MSSNPICERCRSPRSLYRDDDTKYNIRVIACIMCGERTYQGNVVTKVMERVKSDWWGKRK